MRKRIITLVMISLLALSVLTGCGKMDEMESDWEEWQETEEEAKEQTQEEKEATDEEEVHTEDHKVRLLQLGYTDYREFVSGDIAVNVSYQVPFLEEEDARQFPELQKTFVQYGEERAQWAEQSKQELLSYVPEFVENMGTDYSVSFSDESESAVMRADTQAVSIYTYAYGYSGGAHGNYGYYGNNYDTQTGKELALTDVVIDTDAFFDLVLAKLKTEYEDIYDDFWDPETRMTELKENPEIGWTMTSEGVTVYFSPYDLTAYAFGAQAITIYYDEAPEIFEAKYQQVPDAYVIPIVEGENFAYPVNGERQELEVRELEDGDEDDRQYEICLGEQRLALEDYAYNQKGYVLCRAGRYGLYLQEQQEGDGWLTRFIDLQTMTYEPEEYLYGSLGKNIFSYEEQENSIRYREEHMPLLDPTAFEIGQRMDVFGTYMGYRTYAMGEDWIPVTEESRYRTEDTVVLRAKESVRAERVDADGKVIGIEVLPPNTYLLLVYTDNKRTADFQILPEDAIEMRGSMEYPYYNNAGKVTYDETKQTYRLSVDSVGYPRTIQGVLEEDILDGILYAG